MTEEVRERLNLLADNSKEDSGKKKTLENFTAKLIVEALLVNYSNLKHMCNIKWDQSTVKTV